MRILFVRLVSLSIAIVTTCCIPVKKTFTMWPGRTIRVLDATSRAPIAGAKVRVVREKFPHRHEDEVRTFAADAKGEVTLVRETQKQTVYPLMMHGVPGYAFVACAEAPGHASAVAHWTDDESSPLDLALPAGSRPCERGAIGPQKPGAATVQGIEAKNGEWIVELGLARETKLAVGAKLGPLEVVEVTQRSGNDAPVHFAIVRAKGDGASVHYRDAFTIE